MAGAISFVKGHGTENDFVLLPDPDGALELTAARVRALCDRRRGIGADGVLRVLRAETGGWFMDYRNADGGIAEMCGNGVRVFAHYLRDAGLVDGPELTVVTRGGPREVRFDPDGQVSVAMGAAVVAGRSTATVDGRGFDGLVVDVGNPHLACVTVACVDHLDLTVPPGHDPAVFPNGVNVEFVTPIRDGAVSMRVHERGVGETRSCGTGTVAAVLAALTAGGRAGGSVTVHTPGGRLRVSLADGMATLTGPSVLVARGELDAAWWEALDEFTAPS